MSTHQSAIHARKMTAQTQTWAMKPRRILTAPDEPSTIKTPCQAQRRLDPGTFVVTSKPSTVRPG